MDAPSDSLAAAKSSGKGRPGMTVVDADGHVEESVAMFGRLEKEYYDRRPLALGSGPIRSSASRCD